VLGFSFTGGLIPAGSGILTVLSFTDVTDNFTQISLGNFGAVTSPEGSTFNLSLSGSINHGIPDCEGDYYGSAIEDECGECNNHPHNQEFHD
jgi:hypothetical protein